MQKKGTIITKRPICKLISHQSTALSKHSREVNYSISCPRPIILEIIALSCYLQAAQNRGVGSPTFPGFLEKTSQRKKGVDEKYIMNNTENIQ